MIDTLYGCLLWHNTHLYTRMLLQTCVIVVLTQHLTCGWDIYIQAPTDHVAVRQMRAKPNLHAYELHQACILESQTYFCTHILAPCHRTWPLAFSASVLLPGCCIQQCLVRELWYGPLLQTELAPSTRLGASTWLIEDECRLVASSGHQ